MDKEYTPAEAKAWLVGYDEAKRIHGQPTKLITVGDVLEQAGYVKKKEWQGLTDEEIKILATQGRTDFSRPAYNEFYSAIEAKLKEKNT